MGEEGGERYDGVTGLRMGRKPGYPCDGQAEEGKQNENAGPGMQFYLFIIDS